MLFIAGIFYDLWSIGLIQEWFVFLANVGRRSTATSLQSVGLADKITNTDLLEIWQPLPTIEILIL